MGIPLLMCPFQTQLHRIIDYRTLKDRSPVNCQSCCIYILSSERYFHTPMSSSIEKKENIVQSSNLSDPTQSPKSQRHNKLWLVLVCFIVFRSVYIHLWNPTHKLSRTPSNNCPQADILIPEKNGKFWSELNVKIGSAAFKQTAIDWLAGAVRIP